MQRFCCSFILFFLAFGTLYGCSRDEYNTLIINDNASNIINKNFYDQNYTYGAYYENGIALEDPSFPPSRVFVITTQDQLDQIMAQNSDLEVDFASEMLIVYTYTSDYVRKLTIGDISVENQKLSIILSMAKASHGVGDSTQPFQRYVVLKMKKLEIVTAEVTIN